MIHEQTFLIERNETEQTIRIVFDIEPQVEATPPEGGVKIESIFLVTNNNTESPWDDSLTLEEEIKFTNLAYTEFIKEMDERYGEYAIDCYEAQMEFKNS